jgi:hypothetical protein
MNERVIDLAGFVVNIGCHHTPRTVCEGERVEAFRQLLDLTLR